jgi:hypothetical protein
MKNQSGANIEKDGHTIAEYIFGDISSTIYPVYGGLEDWGYGGGWDYENDQATLLRCEPITYLLEGVHQSKEEYETVRSAIYIIETDNSKKPAESDLGSRLISLSKDKHKPKILIKRESIDGFNT